MVEYSYVQCCLDSGNGSCDDAGVMSALYLKSFVLHSGIVNSFLRF